MGSRGRKSSADLAVVEVLDASKLPRPPSGLNADQAEEWRAVVAALPSDKHGRDHWPLLEAYCCHAVAQRRINALIAEAEEDEEFDVKLYDRLCKMLERETRCLASLAIRLGIAQSSRYERLKRARGGPPPWIEG